jgi:hypothetical protein
LAERLRSKSEVGGGEVECWRSGSRSAERV